MTLTESPHHEKPVGDAVTRRLIEIESLTDFDAHISETRRLNGWFVQSVDLRRGPGSDGGSKSRSVFEFLAGITGRGIDDHEAEPVVST